MLERDWPNLNTLWSAVLVDELARCGLRTVVISPGSRSTPLVMAFCDHPDIEDISIIDERSAAFFALGVARATRAPTAIVCTSGTAAANYFPAICEANADDVPLLVLTADRPVDRLESGASQAMDQTKLYGDQVRWFHDLGQPELDARRVRALRSTMGLAWRHATSMTAGPVHINMPFRKPLEPVAVSDGHRDAVPDELPDAIAAAVEGRQDGGVFSPFDTPEKAPHYETVRGFVDALLDARRPVVLAGADARGDDYIDTLVELAELAGIPVLAEPTSGLRWVDGEREAIIGAGDLLLRAQLYERIGEPDLIVQLGKPPLHWAARTLMRESHAARRIAVTPTGRRLDPEHCATWFIEADTSRLLSAALDEARARHLSETSGRGWLEAHRRASAAAVDALDASLQAQEALHEARIWRELGARLPADAALFVSNSMPIRHFDTFLQGRRTPLLPFFNRGLNGIDGILSTGFGVAHARTVPTTDSARRSNTVIVTGDVAFRHDIGALLAGRRVGVNATIVVCDNGGGGIFGALPIAEFGEAFERHFLTPPGIAESDELLGVQVASPESWPAFAELLDDAMSSPGLHIIRVHTDRARDEELAREHVERAADAAREAVETDAQSADNEYSVVSADERAPVVALHGFSGSSGDWAKHADTFADRRLIALDLPGHGAHPHMERFERRGLAAAVDWLDDEVRRRGLQDIHLVGYSMGGRVALQYALEYPSRLVSLSLIGAHPGIRDSEERAERARWDEDMAARLERDGLHAFVDEWMQHPVLIDQLELDHRQVVEARRGRLDNATAGLAAAFREFGTGSQLPLWARLAELEAATLFLAGERDTKYVRIGEEFADTAPEAAFAQIDDAGHNILLERPETTIAAIRAHIERTES